MGQWGQPGPGAGPGERQEESRQQMQLVWYSIPRPLVDSALQGAADGSPWHQHLGPAVCAVPVGCVLVLQQQKEAEGRK